MEFVVQGPDWDKLTEVTNSIMDAMKKTGIVTDVNTDVQSGMPEVELYPNRAKLAEHGVSVNTVTSVVNALVGGAVLMGQTEYSKAHHRYEIELRLTAEQRDKIPDLNKINIRNNRGFTVPLSELVEEKVKPSLMLISRLNRNRAITVYANPAPGHAQDEAFKIRGDVGALNVAARLRTQNDRECPKLSRVYDQSLGRYALGSCSFLHGPRLRQFQ